MPSISWPSFRLLINSDLSTELLSDKTDYPLHLGITEAGSYLPGSIKTSIGFGSLLLEGIGDTIRVSLSDDPTKEIKVGNEILKSLNLRNRGVKIVSCPSCARQAFDVIKTVKKLEEKLSHINTPISLSRFIIDLLKIVIAVGNAISLSWALSTISILATER